MPPKNPWTNISWQNTIADCDKCSVTPYLTGYNYVVKEQQIHNELLPEPFLGDFRAQVYLLNGNPKFINEDDLYIGDSTLENLIQKTLTQNLKGPIVPFIWLNYSQTTSVSKGRHPGYSWWESTMKYAIQDRKALLNKNNTPNMCCIEYIPYLSVNFPLLPNLPSQAYVDYYINNAIENGKWIIVMRHYTEWMKRIPNLLRCTHLLRCVNAQRATISEKNLLDVHKNHIIGNQDWMNLLKAM